jgi:hypothetical protein
VTKGPGSKAAGLAMAFKLLEAAQDRWRAVNGPHLVALVRAAPGSTRGLWSSALTKIRRSPRHHAGRPSTTLDDFSPSNAPVPRMLPESITCE